MEFRMDSMPKLKEDGVQQQTTLGSTLVRHEEESET